MSIRKSMPFLYVSLETHTILIVFNGNRMLGFGANLLVSTALGMVKHILGLILALRVKFSFNEWLTEMAASTSFKYHLHILLRLMHPTSLYAKWVCSVTMVFIPSDLAATMIIAIVMEVLRCPWQISMCSRIKICLKTGNMFKRAKNATSFLTTGRSGR